MKIQYEILAPKRKRKNIHRKKRREVNPSQYLHNCTDFVLGGIPNPFGAFEKAKYVIFREKSAVTPLYFFVTTCHNTEECVEILKSKFADIYGRRKETPKYCSIYKIQGGVKSLIFRKIFLNN